jgi:adenylosuccinate lyase
MIDRYLTDEMSYIWSDTNKFKKWLLIEELVSKYQDTPESLLEKFKSIVIDKERILEIESKTKHDFIAFIEFIEEQQPDLASYLHKGLTSSDVLDTTTALILREAGEQIIYRIDNLLYALKDKAIKHKYTSMLGRSHGMYGEPITFGLVMTSFYSEWLRNKERLTVAIENITYGKISGPMGNYTNISPYVEENVLNELGLKIEPISTQIIPRDRHAEFFMVIGLIGSSLERLGVEIRNLQQSSVGEVSEGFSKGQKGSSAMPHKKNPIGSENICGLARLLRGYVLPVLENVPLWYERDMSHSSVERVVFIDSTGLCDYAIKRMVGIIENLEVHKDIMEKHIRESRGVYNSQSKLMKLMESLKSREKAYEVIQKMVFSGEVLEDEKDYKEYVDYIYKRVYGLDK